MGRRRRKGSKHTQADDEACPRCKAPIIDETESRVCPSCGAEHHAACWEPGCARCAARPAGTTIIAPPAPGLDAPPSAAVEGAPDAAAIPAASGGPDAAATPAAPAPVGSPVEPVAAAPAPGARPASVDAALERPTPPAPGAAAGGPWPLLRRWIDGGLKEEFSTVGSALFLLAVIAVAAYANCFRVPFLFDDAPVVTRNRLLWQWDTWWQLFWWNPGRGLTNLSFLINFQLGGTSTVQPYGWRDWWSFHLVSLALHVVNGLLVFKLVRDLLGVRPEVPPRLVHWVAVLGAAVWLAHPANTMAVTYIAQRYALMAALSFLGTVVLYVRLRVRIEQRGAGIDLEQDWPAILGLVAVALACLFTKENAWTAPLAVLFVEAMFFRGRYLLLLFGLLSAFALLFAIPLRLHMVGGNWDHFFPATSPSGDRQQYLSTQVVVTLRYLHLWLMPHDLCVEQSFPMTWVGKEKDVALALLGHLGIVALAGLLVMRGLRFVPFAIGWYYITHIVESSFIPILDPMVDHRMYLPTALLAAALAVSAARVYPWLAARGAWAREQVVLGCVLLVLLLVTGTLARNTVWTSSTGIWVDTIRKRPDCARAYSSLGMEHLYAGEWLQAVQPIETALELGPYHVEGWNNLGKAYLELATEVPVGDGRMKIWEKAALALERGIEVDKVAPSPSTPLCWNNLGLVFFNVALERPDLASQRYFLNLAVPKLTRAVELDPDYEVAWINLVNAHALLMKLHEGDAALQEQHARATLEAVGQAERVAARRGGVLPLSTYKNQVAAMALAGPPQDAYALARRLAELTGAENPGAIDDLGRVALEAHARATRSGSTNGSLMTGPSQAPTATEPGAAAAAGPRAWLEDAARRLDELLAKDPQRVASRLLRAQLAEALGDRADAAARLRALLASMAEDDPDAAVVRQELRRLGESP